MCSTVLLYVMVSFAVKTSSCMLLLRWWYCASSSDSPSTTSSWHTDNARSLVGGQQYDIQVNLSKLDHRPGITREMKQVTECHETGSEVLVAWCGLRHSGRQYHRRLTQGTGR
ncbi:hypothetical protein IQ06DRAFT_4743 [Phaeosphaeriaceae sp. SRC1lsM3a]|nr:hypothetical protein IQ06DRAFT_4743 [Stagonospora sp. SRC1lsM3a]